MSRRLLLLGLALCCLASASAQPRIELSAAPAWKGWTRPGRTTEIDIRLTSDVETRASVLLDEPAKLCGESLRSTHRVGRQVLDVRQERRCLGK